MKTAIKQLSTTCFWITLLIAGLVLQSCEQTKENNENKEDKDEKLLDFASIENKFKYENLKGFSLDTLGWGKRRYKFYNSLDSITFPAVYQDSTEHYVHSNGDGDADYLYSKQKSKRGLVELTILNQREGAYVDYIQYFIYNKSGKKISSFAVATGGGDGGYYETSYGKFVNDSTYILYMENNYQYGAETHNPDENIITFSEIKTSIKYDGAISQSTKIIKKEIRNEGSENDTH